MSSCPICLHPITISPDSTVVRPFNDGDWCVRCVQAVYELFLCGEHDGPIAFRIYLVHRCPELVRMIRQEASDPHHQHGSTN